ncbi:hypothetical protein BLA39750_01173 [Burkholderia lata]|uniref:Uncharacterized protein n=1 Tax=Burkholderia lata (strain ATCC 17760 / DSM 23089 / LMG 22485 / NCIMB 9086 / R18194 / 383) TaxID=482957 RepID=A0A6P2VGD9_BURL3|nr:hypothetical protein BLA39750_01173 [Burkholderia lata]
MQRFFSFPGQFPSGFSRRNAESARPGLLLGPSDSVVESVIPPTSDLNDLATRLLVNPHLDSNRVAKICGARSPALSLKTIQNRQDKLPLRCKPA